MYTVNGTPCGGGYADTAYASTGFDNGTCIVNMTFERALAVLTRHAGPARKRKEKDHDEEGD